MIEYQSALTPIQAAKYVGISEAALRLWRSEGKGPRHFKAGEKLVRYRRVNLDSWIEVHLSSGWRRSGHKIWVQVSFLKPERLYYSRMIFTKMPSGCSPPKRRVSYPSRVFSGWVGVTNLNQTSFSDL